jgi:hypothetical protein
MFFVCFFREGRKRVRWLEGKIMWVFKDDELLGFLFFIFHFALRPFLEKNAVVVIKY